MSEFALFTYILLGADISTASMLTNARILASQTRESYRKVQWGLYQLRQKRYIYYDDNRGNRGSYNIIIDKFRVNIGKHSFYTNIFPDGQFIGEQRFFAGVKVRKLASILGSVYALCVRSPELETDFVMEFPTDFEELNKAIDLYMDNPVVCDALAQFRTDFEPHLGRTYFALPNIDIYILKKTEKSPLFANHKFHPDSEERMASLCGRISQYHPSFNAFSFVQRSINAKIPGEVIYDILLSLKENTNIENPWGYALTLLERKYGKFPYARSLKELVSWKKRKKSLTPVTTALKEEDFHANHS